MRVNSSTVSTRDGSRKRSALDETSLSTESASSAQDVNNLPITLTRKHECTRTYTHKKGIHTVLHIEMVLYVVRGGIIGRTGLAVLLIIDILR